MVAFPLLLVAMLLACAFFMMRAGRGAAPQGHADDSPEWAVMRAKRDEIESDPTLSDQAREQLRAEWALQAEAVLGARGDAPTEVPAGHASGFAPWLIAALTLGVGVYALIGRWDAEALRAHAVSAPTGVAAGDQVPPREDAKHPGDNLSLEERIEGLKARLAAQPDDLNGWVLLARSYGAQRNFKDGAAALEKALSLAPGHPDLTADLADMLAMTQGRTLTGRPQALLESVLKTDPQHPKALALAATAAMERNDTRAALGYWQRLRDTLAPNSPDLAQIDATMERLRTGGAAPAKAPKGPAIAGTVSASPELIARLKTAGLPPEASLFVLARASGGMPMPLAVVRVSAQALLAGQPIDFRLDDSQSMSPDFKLSSHQKVELEARLSFAGTAARGPNDVSEKLTGIALGTEGVRLVLK